MALAEPTHIRGQVDTKATAYAINQDRRVVDVYDQIFLLEPRKSPMITLLQSIGKQANGAGGYKGAGLLKKETINPEFNTMDSPNSDIGAIIVLYAGISLELLLLNE